MSDGLHNRTRNTWITLSKTANNFDIYWTVIEKAPTDELAKNEHVYVIWCWPEVDGDVISGQNAKTVGKYVVVNFEVSKSIYRRFWDFTRKDHSFCDGEDGDGSSGMNGSCSQPEVVDDDMSGEVDYNFRC